MHGSAHPAAEIVVLPDPGRIQSKGRQHSSLVSFLRAALPAEAVPKYHWRDVTYCGNSLEDLAHRVHLMWKAAKVQGA